VFDYKSQIYGVGFIVWHC